MNTARKIASKLGQWSVRFERPDAADAGWKRVAPGISWQRIVQEDADAVHTTRSVRVDARLLGATGVLAGVAAWAARRD